MTDCKTPIIERIRAAFEPGEVKLKYHELAYRVFPPDQYPRSWNYSSNGGPPGCYMALSAALRRHCVPDWFVGSQRWVGRPKP